MGSASSQHPGVSRSSSAATRPQGAPSNVLEQLNKEHEAHQKPLTGEERRDRHRPQRLKGQQRPAKTPAKHKRVKKDVYHEERLKREKSRLPRAGSGYRWSSPTQPGGGLRYRRIGMEKEKKSKARNEKDEAYAEGSEYLTVMSRRRELAKKREESKLAGWAY